VVPIQWDIGSFLTPRTRARQLKKAYNPAVFLKIERTYSFRATPFSCTK
jgi:hypothetical protein